MRSELSSWEGIMVDILVRVGVRNLSSSLIFPSSLHRAWGDGGGEEGAGERFLSVYNFYSLMLMNCLPRIPSQVSLALKICLNTCGVT